MRIAITGHRPERLPKETRPIKMWLLERFKEFRPSDIYTGMAQGVDQIGAEAAMENGFFYSCVFPFKKKIDVPYVQNLVEHCARVIWTAEKYSGPGDYINRDRYMVDCCNVLLAVWDGIEEGGTWQTIKYARECGKKIIYCPRELVEGRKAK